MRIIRPKSKQPIPAHAKRVFQGEIFDVYQWPQKMYDGTTKTFEKIKRNNSAVIIPVTKDGKIIIANETQPGTKTEIELIRGRIENEENPLSGAKRELLEETGYASKKWMFLKAIQPLFKIDWVVYYFIAKDCQKIAKQKLDSGERIKLLYVTFDEFVENILRTDEADHLKIQLLEAKLNTKKMKALKKLIGLK